MELPSPRKQVFPNSRRDDFTLCDELRGVKLGDDTLQYFIANGRQNTLVVVQTKVLIDFR